MGRDEHLHERVDEVAAASGFAGVVRIDRGDEPVYERAFGPAHRAHGVPMTVGTRLAMASGSKALTALAVLALADDGTLPRATPARTLLGADLPLVDDAVTVEHLLAHRSGVGEYLPEDGDIADHVLTVPVHTLADTEAYVPVLDGRPPQFAPGERFSYCNAGYVLLALLAERATGTPFVDLVQEKVGAPAGLAATAYLRSDDLPADAALGYLHADGDRTNVLHLPVRGTGDGGAFTTVADVHRLWAALDAGRLPLGDAWEPRSTDPDSGQRYGLGFWLHPDRPIILLEGYDAGVSFWSVHDPEGGTTHTVMGGWSDAAWPVARLLDDLVLGWAR